MSLPPQALETFKSQIDNILTSYNVETQPWTQAPGNPNQVEQFYYQSQALHIAVRIQRTQLYFAIAYLTDFGNRYTFLATPDQAPTDAAAVIQKTFQEGPGPVVPA